MVTVQDRHLVERCRPPLDPSATNGIIGGGERHGPRQICVFSFFRNKQISDTGH